MSPAGPPAINGSSVGAPSAETQLAGTQSAGAHPAGTGPSVQQARRRLVSIGLLLLVAVAVVVLDQLTKSWALNQLGDSSPRHVIGPTYLVLTFNKGAAFSLGAGAAPIIEAVAIALVVGVVALSGRAVKGGTSLAVIIGLGLLLGGALSNLGDRLFRHHHGAVVDFIQLVSWWPTFNIADASITVGAVTLVIALVLFPPAQKSDETVGLPTGQPAGGQPGSGSATGPEPGTGSGQSFGRWA
jgi:signal peptidase II